MSWRSEQPRIGLAGLWSEAIRMALATPIASAVTGIVIAGVVVSILLTTGQTVRAERDVLARIDDAGTRTIVAVDPERRAHLDAGAVDRIAALSTVERVIGLGYAVDARNAAIGPAATPVALRSFRGSLDGIDVDGRPPRPGEALVGIAAIGKAGLELPVGALEVDGTQLAVVGSFDADEPFEELDGTLLAPPWRDDDPLRSVHVVVTSPGAVAQTRAAVAMLLGAEDPTAVAFETSQVLADVRAAVQGELGRFSRRLVLGVLAGGLVFVGLVVYGSVTFRRQDFGRRRALGASRGTIVALIAAQYLSVAVVGAGVGVVAAGVVVVRWTGALPDPAFTGAIVILTLLATAAATLVPALVAAYRDPVRVLRVP